MKIKLIALAVASLASSAAFAQSTNTIYGIVDVNAASMNSGYGQKLSLGHSGMGASRLGLSGERDLGTGLKAVYVMEAAVSLDNGVVGSGATPNGINNSTPSSGALIGNGSQIFARQVFFGLKNDLGSLTIGRQYTGSYLVAAGTGNSLGAGLFGYSAAFTPLVGGMPTRVNSSLVYSSPKLNGFSTMITLTTGNENNVDTNTVVGATTTNSDAGRGLDAALFYSNGPLNAAVTTWNVANTSFVTVGETDLATKKGVQLAANYDFGFLKIYGTYVKGEISGGNYENVTKTLSKSSAWSLSGSTPVGNKGRVLASYTKMDDESSLNRDANLIGLAYTYSLYEKTTLYASWGKMSNDTNSNYSLANGGDLVGTVNTRGFSPTGFMVGVNMAF